MFRKLQSEELNWLNRMLDTEFLGKSELLDQIQNSQVSPNYNKGFISLKFQSDSSIAKFPYNVRNPIEMRAYQNDAVPVMFLIHVMNGYLNELEIFNADSSEITVDLSVDNVEIIINSELIKSKK